LRVEGALILAMVMAALSTAANATPSSAPTIPLQTADGLQIHVDPAKPLIRFEEVVEVKGAPNIYKDGPISLEQRDPAPLILSGRCEYSTKAETGGWMNRWLALNISGTYSDGEQMPEQSAYFGQYDHGPQFNARVVCPDKPLSQVEVTRAGGDVKSAAKFTDVTLKAARYRITSPQSKCSLFDSVVSQEFAIKESALAGTVTYQAADDYIVVRCRFASENKTDRAVSAYVAVPFDAVGGTWHDDVRASRKIEAGRIYRRDDRWYGAGRDGYEDRYPLACVEDAKGSGLAIATDLAEPRVFRTEYDAARRELRIRYDIGLSPNAGRWANQGSFAAYLFTYDGADGFRGAADKFQRIFAWAFERRAREGMWIPFVTPESIPGGWEDFHIRFVESVSNMGWEQARGMYSLKYVEPWIHHQQDMPDIVVKTAGGAIDPAASIKIAKQVVGDASVPEDVRRRFAAYPGSCITDNWGQPQGYFFRQPGRKENMMIVNPNPDLPAPAGSDYSSGGWDWANILETNNLPAQWHVDGWVQRKTSETPHVQIDSGQKASGRQSLRLDPAPSKHYYPMWTRGIDQTFYYKGDSAGPFELSYSARAEDVPAAGTRLAWRVTFWYKDGSSEARSIALDSTPLLANQRQGEVGRVGSAWKRFSQTLSARTKPYAITVGFGKDSRDVDPTIAWVDDVRLTAQGGSENLLANGDFESAELMPSPLGGIYLDTMECYANNLNYRREHWRFSEEPPTFDSARKPALHQVFSHITFARRSAQWARARGKIVFANCAPVTCFGAPYADAMGGEEFWAPGGKWTPKTDREFNFVRLMSGSKSWSILQYDNLDADQIGKYAKRCAFYGVYPSWIYKWADPVFVSRIRPLYAKLMPILVEINTAGWRPLTLASSSNPNVWLERFGEGDTIYLTAFNATSEPQSAKITMDKRAGMTSHSGLVEMLDGAKPAMTGDETPSFDLTLAPEDLKVLKLTR